MADILGPEVTSANPYADIDTSQFQTGVWQYEVSVFDGEFWTPFSTESASFTVLPVINVLAAGSSAGSSAPSLEPTARIPAATSSADVTAPGYSNGVVLEVIAATGGADGPLPWRWRDEVTSANPYDDTRMYGWLVGKYQVEVRVDDGEGWSPWAPTWASYDLPPTVAIDAPWATATSLPPSLEPSVRVLAAYATAYPGVHDYSNGIFLEVAQGSALAKSITPWTHLEEVTSTDPFADTSVLATGNLRYQVRVADAEGWGAWSSEYASVVGKIATNLWILLDDGVWHQAQRWVRWDPSWVRHKSQLL